MRRCSSSNSEYLGGKIHRVGPYFGSTLTVANRDSQSNCWVNWKTMGLPCEFQVLARRPLAPSAVRYGSSMHNESSIMLEPCRQRAHAQGRHGARPARRGLVRVGGPSGPPLDAQCRLPRCHLQDVDRVRPLYPCGASAFSEPAQSPSEKVVRLARKMQVGP